MTKEEFFNEVKTELTYIRDHATLEEINRLNFSKFNRNQTDNCIYGQMTGSCDSPRAKELFKKSFHQISRSYVGSRKITFESQDLTQGSEFTALEKYLYMCTKKQHKEIYRYLRRQITDIEIV